MARPRKDKAGSRTVEMSEDPQRPDFQSRFEPDELHEWAVAIFHLGESMTDRLVQRVVTWQDRVVHFAMVQQHHDGAEWVEIARVDTCHSESHIHRFRRSKTDERRQVFRVVDSIEDVESEFARGWDLLVDQWERELRRWRR